MRKDAARTQAFIPMQLGKKLDLLAADREMKGGPMVDEFIRRLAVAAEHGKLQVPAGKREPRAKDAKAVTYHKSLTKTLKILAATHETSIQALITLAIEQGIAFEHEHPTLQAPPAEARPSRATKVIHHDAQVVDALKFMASQRNVSVGALADAALQVVVQNPHLVDSLLDEEPVVNIDATPAIHAAAARAVQLAGGPVRPKGAIGTRSLIAPTVDALWEQPEAKKTLGKIMPMRARVEVPKSAKKAKGARRR